MFRQLLGEVHRRFYVSYDTGHTEGWRQHHTPAPIVPKPYDVTVGESQSMSRLVLRRMYIENHSPNARSNTTWGAHSFL